MWTSSSSFSVPSILSSIQHTLSFFLFSFTLLLLTPSSFHPSPSSRAPPRTSLMVVEAFYAVEPLGSLLDISVVHPGAPPLSMWNLSTNTMNHDDSPADVIFIASSPLFVFSFSRHFSSSFNLVCCFVCLFFSVI